MKQSALTTEQQMVEAVSPMVVVPEDRERGTMCGDLAITKRLVWGRHEQSTWQSSKLRFSQPGLRLTKHLECLQVPTHSGSALLA